MNKTDDVIKLVSPGAVLAQMAAAIHTNRQRNQFAIFRPFTMSS